MSPRRRSPARAPASPATPGADLVAFALGAAAIGALDAARLASPGIALAIVPVFAATGLAAGAVIALARKISRAALVVALPTLIVTVPAAWTLFDGARAQTLPLARAMPVAIPMACWLVAAGAIALGRRVLRGGDLVARSIALLAIAGALGGVVWLERHVLGTGYPDAHAGATFAVIVLAGLAVRVAWSPRVPPLALAALCGLVLGTAAASAAYGLASPADRLRLATYGDQARDLVRVLRAVVDFDRDGASPILGGGDCDDFDASRHPGARDIPGDGIDQDCDGVDASPEPPAPAAVAPSSWTDRARPIRERTRAMTVVLLTVDALRFDLLAPGAPARDDFPRLTRLLDESAWFTHAIAPASATDVSLCTLLAGRFDPYQPLARTLPEAMQLSGRRTYSAIPGEVTRYVGDVLIGRGIDHPTPIYTDWQVADVGDHVSAADTTTAGIRALDDAAGRPAFVWLHYFDVHEHHQIDVPSELLRAVHDASPGAQGRRYRALLRAIDGEIGRFLDELARRKLDAVVVFVSDHGENLGEDPRSPDTHGQVTYAPLVRIPFALRVPGVSPARREDSVSLVDLAPTLADLAALDLPDLDGVDLVPALVGGSLPARPIAIHEELQWSIVEWPYQLIVRPADNVSELYDLAGDPAEHDDLAARAPDVVMRLRARYAAFPEVRVDRTPDGRAWREARAQPPPPRAP